MRLAARRFLRDLERSQGPRPPFRYDWEWADRACRLIETLPHVEENWDTPNLLLEPPQIFFVVQLFGFRSLRGGRRFSEALLLIARKNAKSTLAAAIMVALFVLENAPGAQFMSAATTGDQAKTIWRIASQMIQKRPLLRETFDLAVFAKSIVRYATGSNFVAINAKASTQDGLNPSAVSFDEVHAHKTPDLLNVLRSAGGARESPLWLFLTTEGYPNAGPWEDMRTFAQHVLNRVLRADHFLVLMFTLDEEDDILDESKYIKANPLLVCNPRLLKQIIEARTNALAMPSQLAEFTIKRCNRVAATAGGWVDLPKFERCGGGADIPDEVLVAAPCYGALDLSSTTDMSSFWLLWLVGGEFVVRGFYWVPEDAVKAMTERRTVPYASWVARGLVEQTPGEVIDYKVIEAKVLELHGKYAPKLVAYDPWNAAATATNLFNEGVPMQQFIQGPKSYHPAMQAFNVAYRSGRLKHGGNPVLKWNAANLLVRHDENLNMAPARKQSKGKIDGVCCVLMCFGVAEADDAEAFQRYLDAPVTL